MIDIVDRLRFDATRCELQFSKGVAGNINEAADEIERLRRHAQRAPSQTIPLPLWAAEDLLRWMRRTNDRKPTLYPIGLENLLQALVSALTSTERCDGADDLEHFDGMLDDRERG